MEQTSFEMIHTNKRLIEKKIKTIYLPFAVIAQINTVSAVGSMFLQFSSLKADMLRSRRMHFFIQTDTDVWTVSFWI